jgi:predicted nucleotidyltransferase
LIMLWSSQVGTDAGYYDRCGDSELKELARVIADWAASAPSATIYVYGSRVRGDHRSDSDVDIHVAMSSMPGREFVEWWTAENAKDFAELRAKLPGRLEILDPRDPLGRELEQSEIVYRNRNVVCVWRKRKPV